MTRKRPRRRSNESDDVKFGDLTPWIIEKWRAGRIKDGAKAATVNRDLADLKSSLTKAVGWGLLAGSCFVCASFGINYQFSNRSTLLWLIDGGYHTVQFVLFWEYWRTTCT